MYKQTTHGILVEVEPFYMEERSEPDESRYLWGYRVTIDNRSEDFAQLLSRYWKIIDAKGKIEEVRGAGVIGEQPELKPGDSFQYTSGCPLTTSSGFMSGYYTMRNAQGVMFDIQIPTFSLDLPGVMHTVN